VRCHQFQLSGSKVKVKFHQNVYTGWLKKSKLLYCVNSLLFLATLYIRVYSHVLFSSRSYKLVICLGGWLVKRVFSRGEEREKEGVLCEGRMSRPKLSRGPSHQNDQCAPHDVFIGSLMTHFTDDAYNLHYTQ